jgi:D-alanyl-D-alanine dipeptidase
MTLIPITPDKFDITLDLRYATTNNVTEQAFYKKAHCFLHEEAAEKLSTAIVLANQLELRFKIFDAYRPLDAQKFLFTNCPDPTFVSNPDTGAIPHCRGIAVDLTLIDKSGNELDMGTGFDDFTPQSYHGDCAITPEAQKNRHLLMEIMTTAGWDFFRNEWWHYQLFNPRSYPVIDQNQDQTGIMK